MPSSNYRLMQSPGPGTTISRVCKVKKKSLQLQSQGDEATVCLTVSSLKPLTAVAGEQEEGGTFLA